MKQSQRSADYSCATAALYTALYAIVKITACLCDWFFCSVPLLIFEKISGVGRLVQLARAQVDEVKILKRNNLDWIFVFFNRNASDFNGLKITKRLNLLMVLLISVRIIPVQLVMYDIFPGMSRLGPLQRHCCLPNIRRPKTARLWRDTGLSFHLDRCTQWATALRGNRLYFDGVNLQRCCRMTGKKENGVSFKLWEDGWYVLTHLALKW